MEPPRSPHLSGAGGKSTSVCQAVSWRCVCHPEPGWGEGLERVRTALGAGGGGFVLLAHPPVWLYPRRAAPRQPPVRWPCDASGSRGGHGGMEEGANVIHGGYTPGRSGSATPFDPA